MYEMLSGWRQCNVNPKIAMFMDEVADEQLIPSPDYAVNPERISEWVQAQLPQYRDTAARIAQVIRRIGFDEFLTALVTGLRLFSNRNHDEYGLIVPQALGEFELTEVATKSNWWVTQLALRILCAYNLKLPVGVYDSVTHGLGNGVTTFMMCDDAIYSGTQFQKLLTVEDLAVSRSPYTDDVTMYIVVGYTTTNGQTRILNTPTPYIITTVIAAEHLATLDELLPGLDVPSANKPVTYFQHKMPDSISVNRLVLDGKIIGRPRDDPVNFITGCERSVDDCPPAWYRTDEYLSRSGITTFEALSKLRLD